MDAIRQTYDRLPDVIAVPTALRYRKVEVIILPLDDQETVSSTENEPDYGAAEFFGCLPDFPDRAPQGQYEVREELL